MKYLLSLRDFAENYLKNPIADFLYRRILFKKIDTLNKEKNSPYLERNQIKRIKEVYNEYGKKGITTRWHRFYFACNGEFSPYYIPETLFYTEIEPQLNNKTYKKVLSDKNLLEYLFNEIKQPRTILKNIGGIFQADNKIISLKQAIKLCRAADEIVIKPSLDSGGGKNVRVYSIEKLLDSNESPLLEVFSLYEKDFIIQERVKQHKLMAELNPSSLNTFRVMSLINKHGVTLLSSIIRMGRKGAFTDNSSSGGISCGVNFDGRLTKKGFTSNGKPFYKTDNGLLFKEVKLPFMDKVKETVILLHQRVPYFRLVSWDLAIDNNADVILVEINVWGQDINFHQWNNGAVLSKILSFCYKN